MTLVQQQYKCGISQHPRLLTLSAEALTKVVLIDNVRLPTNPNLGTVTKTDNGPLYFSVCCPRGNMEPRTLGSIVRMLTETNHICTLSGSWVGHFNSFWWVFFCNGKELNAHRERSSYQKCPFSADIVCNSRSPIEVTSVINWRGVHVGSFLITEG